MRQLKITKSITLRNGVLDKYLIDIGKEELITIEKEVELAQNIKKGDQIALNKLVNANLRFVISVAKKYQNQGLSLSDLINEGNIGLIKAAKKYNETKGFRFISYAVWWIRQSILIAIAEQSKTIRLPLNQIKTINQIRKISAKFEQENEYLPSTQEIATILNLPIEKITDVVIYSLRNASLDSPFTDDEESGSLIDVLENNNSPSPDSKLMKESLQKEMGVLISKLSEEKRAIIRYSFGVDGYSQMSKEEISEKMGIPKSRVESQKFVALRLMKSWLKELKI